MKIKEPICGLEDSRHHTAILYRMLDNTLRLDIEIIHAYAEDYPLGAHMAEALIKASINQRPFSFVAL